MVLLGHSMGARTAVHVADDPSVRGVVALAPWFPEGEPVAALAGKRLVAAHGSRDHITSPRATRAFVGRARVAGADATYVDAGRVGHYMLRRAARWNEIALDSSLSLLAPRLSRRRRSLPGLRNETVSFYGSERNSFVPSSGVSPWCPTRPPPGPASRVIASRRSSTRR